MRILDFGHRLVEAYVGKRREFSREELLDLGLQAGLNRVNHLLHAIPGARRYARRNIRYECSLAPRRQWRVQ